MDGCTLASARYTAHARVLAESFLAHNPGARFWVLDVDGLSEGEFFSGAGGIGDVQLLTLADVGVDEAEFHRRATIYAAHALAGSLKAPLLRTVLARTAGAAVYMDADTCVYADLAELGRLAAEHALVFSPHVLTHSGQQEFVPQLEENLVLGGVFNTGLLAVGPGAARFLDWWATRTARHSIFDAGSQRSQDQGWLTVAAALFGHHVLADPGCNVAAWNVMHRDVIWDGERATIDGGPLRHFHFALGFDPQQPQQLGSSPQPAWVPALGDRPGVARLAREYAARLIRHGYRQAWQRPIRYAAMPDGAPIEPWMRPVYRSALIEAERTGALEPANPFTHGEHRFLGWVRLRFVDGYEPLLDEIANALGSEYANRAGHGRAALELGWALARGADVLAQRDDLLRRVGELERVRDEAVAWAQREAIGRGQAEAGVLERDALIRELYARLG